MKQNKYFSPGRFARLFRNDLLINQKTYLFTIIGFAIVIYAIFYFIMRPSYGGLTQTKHYIPLVMIYLMAVGVFIGAAFPALTDQIKTTNYLLAPGSTFEKLMVQFVVRIVLFIPLALCLFWISAHLAKASIFPDSRFNFNPSSIPDFHFSDLLAPVPLLRDKLVIIISIFSVASLLFAGSVYFNRFALVKTLIVTGITIGMVVLAFVLFSHIFYPAETHGFHIELKTYQITENLKNTQLFIYLVGSLSWIFFLVFGYFKLKEKEV
jgi:hypothetical protein